MLRRVFILAIAASLPVMAAAAKFDATVATNQLGLDLYRQLAKEYPGGNLVISPYSIDSALALAYAGADGATRTEMAMALHFPDDDASLQASFGALRTSLDEIARFSAVEAAEDRKFGGRGEAVEWHQANRLFGQQGYAIRPSFLALLKDGYGTPFESLDFEKHAETAREFINSWVEQQTRQRIRGLIPSGGLDDDTRLVLVNALYLKAPWHSQFSKRDTQRRPFHVTGTNVPKVSTMTKTATFGYVKEDGFTVVTLSYEGAGLQFLILLPDEGTSCETLAGQLTPERLHEWAPPGKWPHSARIELYLPKFEMTGATLPLGAALRELGMKRAFDEPRGSADFSRIAERQPDDYLKLAEVFHKTFVAVDEEGTEAAAASSVMAMTMLSVEAPPPKPIVVRVDRPFLFAIQDRTSGVCLFLCRITDPR